MIIIHAFTFRKMFVDRDCWESKRMNEWTEKTNAKETENDERNMMKLNTEHRMLNILRINKKWQKSTKT